ncbi:uncharacterized protein LOC114923311 [Protobothrops mucrosquamatus]|uniref:uncharacterized protein LOC114923311 n=1 Tax=Protobothrops mucrosquamatus TaxID=103944 RepID=UPI0010FAE3AB|nr:uncharacterized protein LOC114923311 [Protobothrops mucrosquamatus]
MSTKSFLKPSISTSLFSVSDTFPYKVRREKIKDVSGAVKSAVWNKFDHKYPPLDPTRVVKRSLHMVNKVPGYNFVTANCEHFATLMRYDKALSDQKDVEHIFQNGDIPKPGDMMQFQLVFPVQHWGIYIGNGEVVHFSLSFSDTFPYKVRREKIKDVSGAVKSAVWNKFDHKYPPLDATRVVKRALHMVNKVPGYNFVTANCEHFATLMRYDKALSDQAERFNFTVDGDFEQEIRRCLAEVDCGSGECLSTFQRKIP